MSSQSQQDTKQLSVRRNRYLIGAIFPLISGGTSAALTGRRGEGLELVGKVRANKDSIFYTPKLVRERYLSMYKE